VSERLRGLIRDIPDFPKPGILFRDITTLLRDGEALRESLDALCEPWLESKPDLVVGIESRGFLLGAPVADRLGVGFVPLRKPGKLPAPTLAEEYALEYGSDRIEMHADALAPGQRVLLVDDLLATGGTAAASVALLRRAGAEILAASFLVELTELRGREKLTGLEILSVVRY
jgi:adenine phosphoribosyltransferase